MTGVGGGGVDRAAPRARRRAPRASARRRRRCGSRRCTGARPPPGRRRPAGRAAASCASAPPPRSSTTPVRTCTTRMPSSAARSASCLPLHAHLRQEAAPGGRLLVERLLAARAVVADRRGADQHRGRALGSAPQRADQVARADHAAVADRLLGARAPALRDRLARQVHDRVASRERLCGGRFGQRVPMQRPRTVAETLPARALRVARQHRHLGAARQQRGHQGACRSGPSPP